MCLYLLYSSLRGSTHIINPLISQSNCRINLRICAGHAMLHLETDCSQEVFGCLVMHSEFTEYGALAVFGYCNSNLFSRGPEELCSVTEI